MGLCIFFKFYLFLFYVDGCFACMYVCAIHECQISMAAEEGIRALGIGVTDLCECWRSNLDPLFITEHLLSPSAMSTCSILSPLLRDQPMSIQLKVEFKI